jgi:hypothetical protein
VVLCLAIVAPALVAVCALAGRGWWPVQDLAIVDLRVRDVWSVHIPLTGMYSRYGWDHPGPLMFWSIGVFSAVTGHAPWATRVGAALLDGAALVALGWVTWRRSVRTLLAAAAVAALTYLASGNWLFREPWNPFVALPFFILFVFLCWLVATGSFGTLIGTALVGSFLVQTHVGYLPFVVAGLVWALVLAARDQRRGIRRVPDWQRTARIAVALTVVAWIPAVVETITSPPGNLTRVTRFFTLGGSHPIGLHRGAGFLAAEFRFVPPWLGGHLRSPVFVGHTLPESLWLLLVPCLLLTLGYAAARATQSSDDARLVGLAALLFIVGLVAISRVTDEPDDYLFLWRSVLAAFVFVAAVWPIAAAVAPRVPRVVRVLGIVAVISVVFWGSARLARSETSSSGTVLTAYEPVMHQITTQLGAQRLPGRVVLDFLGTAQGGVYSGVVDQLARQGVTVYARVNPGRAYGPQRSYHSGDTGARWYVIEQASYASQLLDSPGARVIASYSPLTPAQDRELLRLDGELTDELRAAGSARLEKQLDNPYAAFLLGNVPGIDHRALDQVGQLDSVVQHSGRCYCGVIAVDRDARVAGTHERPATARRPAPRRAG